MVMAFPHIKFHISISNCRYRRKAEIKYGIHATAMLLIYILQKLYHNKVAYFSQIYQCIRFQYFKLIKWRYCRFHFTCPCVHHVAVIDCKKLQITLLRYPSET
jgi:hypothetical protein